MHFMNATSNGPSCIRRHSQHGASVYCTVSWNKQIKKNTKKKMKQNIEVRQNGRKNILVNSSRWGTETLPRNPNLDTATQWVWGWEVGGGAQHWPGKWNTTAFPWLQVTRLGAGVLVFLSSWPFDLNRAYLMSPTHWNSPGRKRRDCLTSVMQWRINNNTPEQWSHRSGKREIPHCHGLGNLHSLHMWHWDGHLILDLDGGNSLEILCSHRQDRKAYQDILYIWTES